MASDKAPTAVDLFCGVGGMSLGFEQAGFDIVAAFDSNPRCVTAYRANFPTTAVVQCDLEKATGSKLLQLADLRDRRIDVVFGGPPCGGFSVAGLRDPRDPRNELLIRFATLVCQLRPKYFVMENVRGLLVGSAFETLRRFRRVICRGGFDILWPVRVLDSSAYGVPQRRQRVFVLGHRRELPAPTYPPGKQRGNPVTVSDAISDLALIDLNPSHLVADVYNGPLGPPSSYVAQLQRSIAGSSAERSGALTGCERVRHSATTIGRFRNTTPGSRESISRFYRLHYDGQSPTIRAGTDLAHGKFTAVRPIHPEYPRCITVREAARLHSFPDWFQFDSTKWHGFMQVGNSVPPRMARAIADSLLHTLI